jgi:HSP20 family protein
MANIVVSRGDGGQRMQMQPSVDEWDPFRGMRELLRWDPFRSIAPLATFSGPAPLSPDFEIRETKDGYRFTADVPGIKEQDLDITCTGDRLTITGKRDAEQQDKGDNYFVYERAYGTFTRSFTMPSDADVNHIRAELKDGVLTLLAPKHPEAMPKKIPVQAIKSKS